jgi:RNA polymerase sigma-70 factor (ECF subfamily)
VPTLDPQTAERERIAAAQQDLTHFDALYEANFDRVYAFIARRVPTRDEAEDLTSDVFRQALESLPTFQWQGTPFAAWLIGIASHQLARRWQRITKNSEVATGELELEDATLSAERQAVLAQLLDRLPGDQRHVLIRRFIDQHSIREIAHELNRSEGAVKQLQFRALETLRNQLRSRYDEPTR